MGRYTQRRRAGGSPGGLNYIRTAQIVGQTTAQLRYNQATSPTALDGTDFTSNPSGTGGDSWTGQQNGFAVLEFADDITGDTSITYSGTAAGFVHPQTKTYS